MKSRIKRPKKENEQEQWAKKADITFLYNLHNHPKLRFGAQKCREIYLDMIRNHFEMAEKWQCKGDDSHYWIMEGRLKADGIDVDALIKEGEELAKELEKGKIK